MKFRVEVKQTKVGNCYIEANSKDVAIQQFYLHLEEFIDTADWYDSEVTVNEVVEEEEEELL